MYPVLFNNRTEKTPKITTLALHAIKYSSFRLQYTVLTRLVANITGSITAGAGTCAFQIHVNFSHAHVSEAVERADGLAFGFEKCYVFLVRPNTDALQNFQASV